MFNGALLHSDTVFEQPNEIVMKTDEKSARLRAHRNNIYRYSGLLATHLSDLERAYIEGRLSEERASMEALMKEAFPFTLPAVQCAAPNTPREPPIQGT